MLGVPKVKLSVLEITDTSSEQASEHAEHSEPRYESPLPGFQGSFQGSFQAFLFDPAQVAFGA